MDPDLNHVGLPNGNAAAMSTAATDDSAAGRRKSGRVSKKPDLYMQDFTLPTNGAVGKRKRVASALAEAGADPDSDPDDDLDDASAQSDDEPDPDDGDEDAYHRERPRAKKRKPGRPAAARKSLAVRPAAARATNKPSKPRRGRRAINGESGSLFDDVFVSDKSLTTVVEEWTQHYQRDGLEALRDLVNLVLESAGCPLRVSSHEIDDQDNVPGKLADLQDEFQAQNITEYPLISKARSSHAFRSTLTAFVHALVSGLHASNTLYDDEALMENIQVWTSTMSSSALRPFRHTATVVSLAIVTALCDVAATLADTQAKQSRQLQAETKKRSANKGRLQDLQRALQQLGQRHERVEATIKDLFDSVFVHRYRDVDPRIRAECVQALGDWILRLPDHFFEGRYLRYLGWVLSDTAGPTRLEVVRQLQRLFKDDGHAANLRPFTDRFRPRLVEMASRDADPAVRAAAVDLLDRVRDAGLLEPDDVDRVGRLLFDVDPRVRRAVVTFVAANLHEAFESKVEDLGGEDAIDGVLAAADDDDDDFERPRVAWLKLKSLVELLATYDDADRDGAGADDDDLDDRHRARGPTGGHDLLVAAGLDSRLSLAAQALCEHLPDLADWRVLVGYLLFDHSEAGAAAGKASRRKSGVEAAVKEAFRLTEHEERILLDILHAAVKRSLSDADDPAGPGPGRGRKKANRGARADGAASAAHESLARQLAPLIPRLLKKFGDVPATASAVLRLEHPLDLDVFHALRQDSTGYAAFLDDINKQFLTHADPAVLTEATASLLHAKSFDELDDVTDRKLHELWHDTVDTLHALLRDKDLGLPGAMSNNALHGLVNTVRRIGHLACIADCTDTLEQQPAPSAAGRKAKASRPALAPIDCLLQLLRRATVSQAEADAAMEDELVAGAIKAVVFYFMWKVAALKARASAPDRPVAAADVGDLVARRGAFAAGLMAIVRQRSGADGLRLAAAGAFLDLYTLLATLRSGAGAGAIAPDAASALIRDVPAEHQAPIVATFAAVEQAYARKIGRTLEAGEEDAPMDDDDSDAGSEADDDGQAQHQRHGGGLVYEQRLCELAGKIVLAIVAKVLDASGPSPGRIRERLQRNRTRLGPNYREVVAHLEAAKAKGARKVAAKSTAAAKAAGAATEADDALEDAADPIEEGDDEDLRNRELAAEDIDVDSDGPAVEDPAAAEPEDDIMGD